MENFKDAVLNLLQENRKKDLKTFCSFVFAVVLKVLVSLRDKSGWRMHETLRFSMSCRSFVVVSLCPSCCRSLESP